MTPKPPLLPPATAPQDDPDAPPSEEEVVRSDALRRALDDPSLPDEAAELARAASLAHAPRAIDPTVHRRMIESALARPSSRGGRLVRVSFGVGAAIALAAGVAFFLEFAGNEPSARPAAAATVEVFRARSTQPLFDAPFKEAHGGSSRIDRIAMARASDFRDNEFARWGAR